MTRTIKFSQVTLAFDPNGFSGNAVTMSDKKTRVMRGKRVGTRPVSANNATDLQFGKYRWLGQVQNSGVSKVSIVEVPGKAMQMVLENFRDSEPRIHNEYIDSSDVAYMPHNSRTNTSNLPPLPQHHQMAKKRTVLKS